MNINFKKRNFLLISTSMVLTACGGGSGQNNDASVVEKPTQEDILYQVYYQSPNISLNIYSDYFEITSYSILKNEFNFSKSHNQPLEQQILTETKILEKGTPQTNIVKRISSTQWLYERTADLKQNLNFEVVKLDGENIFDRMLPGYRENFDLIATPTRLDQDLIKFYQNYKDSVFPKDSYCYRLKETQWSQSFLESGLVFSPFSFFNEQKQQMLSRYNNLGEDKKYFKFLDTQWHGYNLISLDNLETGQTQSLLGNRDNQAADIQFVSSTLWNVDKNLNYEKSHLYSGGDTPIDLWMMQNQRLNIAKLEKGCFAFNTQAISAVKKLNLINWKQGDSSDVGQFLGARTWTYRLSE
ncbi:hypothetical protein [Acinetobacter sp. ANC 3882]|uniref:hypothetical protein n=1 Tax=Acinetobacter sp. ANC 3882 TaxID=2923423 RepID=UPI001F4A7FAC|nr:hypothetical protein [Acinetobacter sp. ANC 3882]MCH7313564.1 hypothetical protein [Acinetobacter sp. ANC 3882]